jgi:hypothetical protein
MEGERAIHALYEDVASDDIPFAQDCVGDQFLLRDGHVLRLLAETGEIEGAAIDLRDFFGQIERDPVEFLSSAPDHKLEPGQLLHAYPPFCMKEAAKGCSLQAVPAGELILFHAELAARLKDVPDGGKIRFSVVDDERPEPSDDPS